MKKRILIFLSGVIILFISCESVQKFDKKSTYNKPKPTQGEDYFYLSHSYPYNKIDYEAQKNAAKSFKNSFAMSRASQTTAWEFAGPVNIGGRIVDIEFDPINPQIAYLAAASGGVFKSIDGGVNWVPIFDNETTLSIGDIAIAPSDPDIIYVGTGEANGGSGSLTYDANGIYKSTDAGASWTNVGLQNTHMTGRVAVHPTDANTAFAACMGDMYGATPDRGLYKTTNGGTTWTNVLFIDDSTGVIDVVINPVNPTIVFAATWKRSRYPNSKDYAGVQSGMWKSIDGGNTFTQLSASNGLPPVGVEYSRIGIDLCAATPNVVYCLYIDAYYQFLGIYKSIDNGDNWLQTNDLIITSSGGGGQFYWYGRVKCDPVDSDVLYVIGFDMFKTDDGGNFYNSSFVNAHVDQHAVAIHPSNPAKVLLGNDGGLYISEDGGSTWEHNETLPISQIYRAEIDFSNPHSLYFGLQDNGTNFTPSGNTFDYLEIFGGDGFQCLVDPANTGILLAGYQFGNIFKFDGISWNPSSQNGVFGPANWNYPLTADPQNPAIVYTGSQRVFQSQNFGDSWVDISPDLTTFDTTGTLVFGTITFIDVSPLNSDIIYAGTDDGKVWNTLNGGTSWTQINNGLPVRWVTCVETDPFDQATAYVTISGYRFHDVMSHVYKTTNNGLTWTDIGSTLPDIPCNNILADPTIPDLLYLATDVGVYFTNNSGNDWFPVADGMPIVVCTDLKIHNPTRTLVVGTYGRSSYKIDLNVFVGLVKNQNISQVISIFPNPVINNFATLEFSLLQIDDISVSVFNLAGKSLSQQSLKGQMGKNIYPLDFKNASPGVYMISLKIGDERVNRKVVVN